MRRALVACLLLLVAAPAPALQHHLIIVSGIGGTPDYSDRFASQARRLATVARQAGIAEQRMLLLSAEPAVGEQPATKDTLRSAISRVAQRAAPEDRIFLVLIGHGNARGDSAVFNLPGPDVSAGELAAALAPLGERQLIVVNTASASGPFIARLSGENRVVITATASGREYHATLFGEYFVAAFETAGADRDKDQRISMLEAFEYARREVRRSYESEKRLLIEHAMLDDNGDGEGSLEPGEFEPDGALAHRSYLQQPLSSESGASGELLAMQERKQALELSISELKQQREVLPREKYYQRLESLLVDLALLSREIRAQGG